MFFSSFHEGKHFQNKTIFLAKVWRSDGFGLKSYYSLAVD